MESCEMLKAKGMNTSVSCTIHTNGGMCYQGFKFTQQLFFYTQLTDWLTGTKTRHLAKRWWSQLKGKPQRSKALEIYLFFFFPNNIFIITTLHLLPLLQISCWKKQRHTKDPGESWDSALIGKPFNIWKYNLTFLSIEEPLRGRAGGGDMLSSHRNLPAHANKRVLSPVFILFSLISPRLLGPHTPAQSRHHKSTCVCEAQLQGKSPKALSHLHKGCTPRRLLVKTLQLLLGVGHFCHPVHHTRPWPWRSRSWSHGSPKTRPSHTTGTLQMNQAGERCLGSPHQCTWSRTLGVYWVRVSKALKAQTSRCMLKRWYRATD